MTTPGLMRAYKTEMEQGYARLASLDLDAAFQHFERAHILGQRRTWLHVRAHAAMLKVGWLRSDVREIAAQLNVSALKPMPIPEDIKRILAETDAQR
jgi:hypothetical protein